MSFATQARMSKQHPNQAFYKVGGSGQSEGSDRGDDLQRAKQEFAQTEKLAKHPALRTAKKK
jgi:hypothetical protein